MLSRSRNILSEAWGLELHVCGPAIAREILVDGLGEQGPEEPE